MCTHTHTPRGYSPNRARAGLSQRDQAALASWSWLELVRSSWLQLPSSLGCHSLRERNQPGATAWQTPGVGGGKSFVSRGRGEVHLQSLRGAPGRGGRTCLGHPSPSGGDHRAPSCCILPFQQAHSPGERLKLSTCAPEGHWKSNHNTRVKEKGDGKGALQNNFKCVINEAFLYWFVYDCYCPCNWTSNSCWLYFLLDCENINWTNNKSWFHKYCAFTFAHNKILNKKHLFPQYWLVMSMASEANQEQTGQRGCGVFILETCKIHWARSWATSDTAVTGVGGHYTRWSPDVPYSLNYLWYCVSVIL